MDVELHQIMTALELTFMNLCGAFMHLYLGGGSLQLDTRRPSGSGANPATAACTSRSFSTSAPLAVNWMR